MNNNMKSNGKMKNKDLIKKLKKDLKVCQDNLKLFNNWSAWSYEKNKETMIKDRLEELK